MTDSKTATELLPCPFCGGEAELTYLEYDPVAPWFIQCANRECEIGPATWRKTEADAIEAWNKRTKLTCEFEWSLADNGWADHTCSRCGYTENTDIHVSLGYNYCPNCGRKVVDND